jgi:hypothetical protein
VLLNLPEEQQAKLAEWLLQGMPYHEAKVLVEKEFAVEVKSLSSFKGFWAEVCQPALLARRRRAVSGAEARADEAQRHPAMFDRATLDALEQKAYELSERPDPPAKDVKAVLMLLLKARDQDFKREKLAFDKTKFQWDAAEACLELLPELKLISQDKGLSEPQKVERIRQKLFGVLPETGPQPAHSRD